MRKGTLKCDLEHTYEFTNLGDDWTRADGSIIAKGQSFRALSTELDEIEEKAEQFKHERTLPFPPADLLMAPTPVEGFQRKQAAAQTQADEKSGEQPKAKKSKKSEASRKAHVG